MKRACLLAACALVPFLAAAAAARTSGEPPAETAEVPPALPTVVLDTTSTRIAFTLGATLHTVEGSFAVREGRISFDPAGGRATGRVVVDATSGDTGNAKRDRKMHREVLESERYPEIVFTPSSVAGHLAPQGTSHVTLAGTVSLHGGSHPLSIPTDVTVDGDRVTATGTFAVPYVEWGLEDPSAFILRVEKHVDVTLEAVGRLER